MNKKIVTLIVSILFVAVLAPISAFAAWNWVSNTKVENNTVTVETPVYVTIGGDSMIGTVKPGLDGSDTVTSTFNINVDNAEDGKFYSVKITNIKKGGLTESNLTGWQFAVDEGEFAQLEESSILIDTAVTDESITLKIKATEDLDESWAGQQLSFTIELVEKN